MATPQTQQKTRGRQGPRTVADRNGIKSPAIDKPLTDQERIFVGQYVMLLDAYKAAILAGYAESVARTKAYTWVSNSQAKQAKPNVFVAVRRAMDEKVRKIQISKDSVLDELGKLAFANMRRFGAVTADGQFVVDLNLAGDDDFAAVQELVSSVRTTPAKKSGQQPERHVTTKLRLASKREALVDLGRHLGIFNGDGAASVNVSFTITGLVTEQENAQ